MRKYSLRIQLILPFVTLMLLAPLVTGWMLHRSGVDTVSVLVRRVLLDLVAEINTATEKHLTYAQSMLGVFVSSDDGERNEAVFRDMAALEKRAAKALRQAQEPGSYVSFGGIDGRFLGLYRVNSYLQELYVRLPGAAQRNVFALGDTGAPPVLLRSDAFDPRSRPWYLSAFGRAESVWSPVYFDFTSKKPVITLARSISDERDRPIGVAAVDIELHMISERLRSLAISRNGVAFVMDGNGRMLASSEPDLPLVAVAGKTQAVLASEMENPLIRAALAPIKHWRRQAQRNDVLSVELDGEAGPLSVAASAVGKGHGLDWVTVVVTPNADFVQDITRSYSRSMIMALACVVVALVLGMWVLNRVLRDIGKLNEAAICFGRGEPLPTLDIDRNDEIGQLARSFLDMGRNLRTDRLTGSYNREYLLNRIRLIGGFDAREIAVRARFALLFVDLDDFKAINDRYGHDAGDAVLVAVAARLNAAVRSSDTVVRYGGDEFVVLLNDVGSEADVLAAQEKLRAAVEVPIDYKGQRLQSGMSIGWALSPDDGTSADDLLKLADQRMFQAKRLRKSARDGANFGEPPFPER